MRTRRGRFREVGILQQLVCGRVMNARSGWIASNTSVDSYFGETQLRIHAIRYYLSTATSVHKLDAIFTYLG
jgi:hypothetical protein